MREACERLCSLNSVAFATVDLQPDSNHRTWSAASFYPTPAKRYQVSRLSEFMTTCQLGFSCASCRVIGSLHFDIAYKTLLKKASGGGQSVEPSRLVTHVRYAVGLGTTAAVYTGNGGVIRTTSQLFHVGGDPGRQKLARFVLCDVFCPVGPDESR